MRKSAQNSSGSAASPGKPFPKGKSGNPGGRPKKREDLAARCIKAVDDTVVDKWIAEVDAHGEDWVECSKLLAAYGYGKPVQHVKMSANVRTSSIDPRKMTDAQLQQFEKLATGALGDAGPADAGGDSSGADST